MIFNGPQWTLRSIGDHPLNFWLTRTEACVVVLLRGEFSGGRAGADQSGSYPPTMHWTLPAALSTSIPRLSSFSCSHMSHINFSLQTF